MRMAHTKEVEELKVAMEEKVSMGWVYILRV
jgi:hypothetical protein